MAFDPVITKRHNYRLWQSGAFGNKLRAWRTYTEWYNSGFGGNVVLRSVGFAGGRCEYNIAPAWLAMTMGRWVNEGVALEDMMINEAAPDHAAILQGEYDNALWGCFLYSRCAKHMRDALREAPQETYGLRSDMLLRGAMTPSSYEDWRVLLDQYPGHVLEVSVYDRCIGDTPGRNALVWEVRRY